MKKLFLIILLWIVSITIIDNIKDYKTWHDNISDYNYLIDDYIKH